MELTRQRFAKVKQELNSQADSIEVLEKRTEKSGETDGFIIVTFANLPFAPDVTQTRFLYVSDGRDVGEGAGVGTGVLVVYKPASDDWFRVADNTVITV